MISATIVNRYAHALADVILESSPTSGSERVVPAEAVARLRAFRESAAAAPELQTVLASPAVSKERKRAVIRAMSAALGLPQIIVNFLLVLSDRQRWTALDEVIEALDAVLDDRLGFERAQVRSAYPLSDRQRDELTRELARIAGRKVRLSLTVDPGLIGGVTARVGSTVYDGSVRGHLAKMRGDLAANRY